VNEHEYLLGSTGKNNLNNGHEVAFGQKSRLKVHWFPYFNELVNLDLCLRMRKYI